MTQTAPKKRAYHSPLRVQRAQETRDRVIAAAGDQFNEHGFAGTTMAAIARAAIVSVESVHAVGTKGTLLVAAYSRRARPSDDQDAEGAADGIPAATDLDVLVTEQATMNQRSSGLWQALRAAAPVDDTVASALNDLMTRRREGFEAAVDRLAEAGILSSDDQRRTQIAAALAVLLSSETYHQLVHDWGLSREAYEDWLRRAITSLGERATS